MHGKHRLFLSIIPAPCLATIYNILDARYTNFLFRIFAS